MRRIDREMPIEFGREVIDKCEWAVLAMTGADNTPYAVAISICRKADTIYFHSAKEGKKIDILRQNPRVCLSCVGDTFRTPDKFTTEYESAYVEGIAQEVESEEEKILALKLLCERHTPTNMHEFDMAIAKSLARTAVWKIDITHLTAKRKKYDREGIEMKFGRME